MIQRNTALKFFAFLITILLVAILIMQISITDVIITLLSIKPTYLIGGLFFYFGTYLMRAVRFSLLLNHSVNVRELVPLMCIHNMMNTIFPVRTGEISYIYLLKKVHKRTTGEGVATLVVSRVFDFILTILLLIVSAFFIHNIPTIVMSFLWLVIFILFLLLILIIALISYGHSFLTLFGRILAILDIEKTKAGKLLFQKGEETIESFEKMNIRRVIIPVIFISLFIWLFNIATMYLIFIGMKITIPIQNIVFGATFLNIAMFLPINGIAGFGTTEAMWTLIFIPLGMTTDEAIISGFSYHIISLIYILLFGLIGSCIIKWKNATE
ncbi:lysylphosphatidylglycerol synthase transmembrane domain-containing protein [Methanospirillum purgamenti]|nr:MULTISPECIES: lysylphosphatidylglycerol synthase transmembrane domain-containing protein [Methanospirillum]MDX8549515.1 lysylphosphatidylglycerol synthase transmembrane domain-containing protein [Methanospirillum hungatei]